MQFLNLTKKKSAGLNLFLCTLFFLSSCVSLPGDHQGALKNAVTGNYEKSLSLLEQKKNSVYGKQSDVLYYLDTGILNHYGKNYQDSIKNLSAAENKIYDLYTKSITAEIGSFILNDSVREYSGEDYEDIYLNVFNSLNYFYQDKIDDAIVETNRAINKSKALSSKYEAELIKARNAAKSADSSIKIESSNTSVNFHDSALVEYLSILYRRAILDYDGVYTSYRMLQDDFLTQPKIYNFKIPSTVQDELSVPKNAARLNVISFSGLSPYKDEFVVKDYYGLADYSFSLALPVLVKQPYNVSKITVTAVNKNSGKKETCELELLESLENVATETFELHKDVIYAKSIARAVTKSIASGVGMAVGSELATSESSDMQLAGSLIQFFTLFGNVVRQAVDHADMRISRYFPSRASVAGINLEEGIYDIRIDYYEKNNKLVNTDFYDGFTVEKGKLNLIESVWLGGNAK